MRLDESPAGHTLPTRAELAGRWRAYARVEVWHTLVMMVLAVATLAAGLTMTPWLARHGHSAVHVGTLSAMLAIASVWDVTGRWIADRYGVTCPGCRRPPSRDRAPIAVATGTCQSRRCGARVARADAVDASFDSPHGPSTLPTRSELTTRVAAFRRGVNRVDVVMMALTLPVFCGGFAAVLLSEARWLQWSGVVLLLALIVGADRFHWRLATRRARRHGLVCPGCAEPLAGPTAELAARTGNCGLCAAAVARPDPRADDFRRRRESILSVRSTTIL